MKILYCEKNRDLGHMLKRRLESYGIETDYQDFIDHAMAVALIGGYDAVVTDLDTPCSDKIREAYRPMLERTDVQDSFIRRIVPGGTFLLLHLNARNFRGKKIIASGIGNCKGLRQILDAQLADYYLEKPFPTKDLVAILQESKD